MTVCTEDRIDLATEAELAAAATIAAHTEAPTGRGCGRRQRAASSAIEFLVSSAAASLDAIVKDAARGRQRTGVDTDDLLQEAHLAALTAARTWDPERYPSWTAYAAAAAKRSVSAILDSDEGGRIMTRATSRMLRHARGIRLSAEARGERPAIGAILDEVLASNVERANLRGADATTSMSRTGEAKALREDLPFLLTEGAPVRLDAPLEEGGDSIGSVLELGAGQGPAELLGRMAPLLDHADVEALINAEGRLSAPKRRVTAVLSAPHMQWAMLGPAPTFI